MKSRESFGYNNMSDAVKIDVVDAPLTPTKSRERPSQGISLYPRGNVRNQKSCCMYILVICIIGVFYYAWTDTSTNMQRLEFTLPSKSLSKQKRPKYILCVGDSITRGAGASKFSYEGYDFNEELTSYPAMLNKKINRYYTPKDRFRVLNFGLRGATAQKPVDNSISYWGSVNFTNALAQTEVAAVIIQFGTNDAKHQYWNESRFVDDYSELISMFRKMHGKPRIFLSIPPPLVHRYAETKLNMSPHVINNKYPYLIPRLAKANDANIIDIFKALGGYVSTTKFAGDAKKGVSMMSLLNVTLNLNGTVASTNTTRIYSDKGTSLVQNSYDELGTILSTVTVSPTGDRVSTKILKTSKFFIDRSGPIKSPNDGCHPRDEGYKVMSDEIFRSLLLHKILPLV